MDRRQVSAESYRRKRAAERAAKNTALPARRAMGVSQDRFAGLLGISAATVRNLEQGRTKPTGPTSKLLSIAEQYPQIFISPTSAKVSSRQVQVNRDKAATLDSRTNFAIRNAQALNRRDELARQRLAAQRSATKGTATVTSSKSPARKLMHSASRKAAVKPLRSPARS